MLSIILEASDWMGR